MQTAMTRALPELFTLTGVLFPHPSSTSDPARLVLGAVWDPTAGGPLASPGGVMGMC